MAIIIRVKSIDGLAMASQEILKRCEGKKIFAFEGEMGSGKTTIIKSICLELEVVEKAVSPTFAIVNEYKGIEKIFHIDLYRLRNLNEALDIGIEEYLSGNEYCFIEWPQLISSLLPFSTVQVNIAVAENDERIISIKNE